jgi:hypothetical protein
MTSWFDDDDDAHQSPSLYATRVAVTIAVGFVILGMGILAAIGESRREKTRGAAAFDLCAPVLHEAYPGCYAFVQDALRRGMSQEMIEEYLGLAPQNEETQA